MAAMTLKVHGGVVVHSLGFQSDFHQKIRKLVVGGWSVNHIVLFR